MQYGSRVKNYNQVKIGTINVVRTAKCQVKLAEFVIQMKTLQLDICCMQEARIAGQDKIEFNDDIL